MPSRPEQDAFRTVCETDAGRGKSRVASVKIGPRCLFVRKWQQIAVPGGEWVEAVREADTQLPNKGLLGRKPDRKSHAQSGAHREVFICGEDDRPFRRVGFELLVPQLPWTV